MNCFKAYDIRGRVPDELNEDIAYRIGRAYATYIKPKRVIVGRDNRFSSESLCQAVTAGLAESGVDVFDIGRCGTEQVYFATFHENMDGGIMVTASHNPMDYNGMKLVRGGSKPISGDTGLNDIQHLVIQNDFPGAINTGSVTDLDICPAYIDHLLHYVDTAALSPLKIVVNAGNGCAGPVLDLLEKHLPFTFIKIHHLPDGSFPNGVPNPLIPENRTATIAAIKEHQADMGIGWDGDFDRCFLYDAQGRFIEGYYLVGLLAKVLLGKHPKAKIIHDPRLTWNTIEQVRKSGGIPVQSKTGHAFIKERMRIVNAVYGGEMSSHHYFRDFAYCDSGMIPWLLVTEIMSRTNCSLAELVEERMAAFPCSGEVNYRIDNVDVTLKKVINHFLHKNPSLDHTDGIGLEFPQWRFNLRASNTEPLLRLNVETRGDAAAVIKYVTEIESIIYSRS